MRELFFLLLTIAILFPFIRVGEGLPSVRPEFLMVPLMVIPFFLLRTTRPVVWCHGSPCSVRWIVPLALSIMLSMVWASLFLQSLPTLRDFLEFVKLGAYAAFYFVGVSYGATQKSSERTYRAFVVVVAGSLLVAGAQLLDPPGFNSTVTAYYAPTQLLGLERYGRITGTFTNPNDYGAFLVMAGSISLSSALWGSTKRLRRWSWTVFAVFCLGIAMTISRSGMVAMALATGYLLFLRSYRTRQGQVKVNWVSILFLLGIVSLLVVRLAPSTFLASMSQVFSLSSASSWEGRVAKWQMAILAWKTSPLLGWGPAKASMPTVVDNEWILLLRRYGVIGLLIFIGWARSIFRGLGVGLRSRENRALAAGLRATLLSYALIMIVGGVYGNEQTMVVLMLLVGVSEARMQARRGYET